MAAEEKQDTGNGTGADQTDERTLLYTLVNPVEFAGTYILTGVDAHGLAEGHIGQHGETVHTHNDDIAGNNHLTHLVGQIHNHHTGRGHDGLGNTGGKTQGQDPLGDIGM